MLRDAEADVAAVKKEMERVQSRAEARDRELAAAKDTLAARVEAREERRRMLNAKVIQESNCGNVYLIFVFYHS